MKKRLGFVSNSSSSSFCVFGTWIDNNNLKTITKKLDPTIDTSPYEYYENLYNKYIPSYFEIIVNDNNEKLIGKSYETMNQEETRKEFELEVINCFKNIGLSNPEFLCGEIYT